MSVWQTPDGLNWYGPDERGDFHPEGADTDMSDMSRAEVEEYFGELTETEFVDNFCGQVLRVGDVVGWGHRRGNYSDHQVGVVLGFKVYHDQHNRALHKVRCYWVYGGTHTKYASSTEANDVFLLDANTLRTEVRQAVALARSSQLPS